MKQLLRLTSYGRRFWPQLLLSVLLMAAAGGARHASVLIQPIFDRVLASSAPEPHPALAHPILDHQSIWTT